MLNLETVATMGIFRFKSKIKEPPLICGKVFNFIRIDSINEQSLNDFYWKKSRKRKGLITGKVEMVYLEPGEYSIVAHGVTYQTSPALIHASIEADQNYILGADEDGLYVELYDYNEV